MKTLSLVRPMSAARAGWSTMTDAEVTAMWHNTAREQRTNRARYHRYAKHNGARYLGMLVDAQGARTDLGTMVFVKL